MNKVEGEKQGGYCRIYLDLCPTAKQGFGCQCIVEIVVKVERGSPQWIKYGLLRRLSATTISIRDSLN